MTGVALHRFVVADADDPREVEWLGPAAWGDEAWLAERGRRPNSCVAQLAALLAQDDFDVDAATKRQRAIALLGLA